MPAGLLNVRLPARDRLGHETADELAEHILRMMGVPPPRREIAHCPTAVTPDAEPAVARPDWVFPGFGGAAARLPSRETVGNQRRATKEW